METVWHCAFCHKDLSIQAFRPLDLLSGLCDHAGALVNKKND